MEHAWLGRLRVNVEPGGGGEVEPGGGHQVWLLQQSVRGPEHGVGEGTYRSCFSVTLGLGSHIILPHSLVSLPIPILAAYLLTVVKVVAKLLGAAAVVFLPGAALFAARPGAALPGGERAGRVVTAAGAVLGAAGLAQVDQSLPPLRHRPARVVPARLLGEVGEHGG